ncbi:MAG: PAS domain S-box protein [Gammaproteobacteria bacterium]|nr:PAS domain S-box protein [Gammaproteobacteria bacterium]
MSGRAETMTDAETIAALQAEVVQLREHMAHLTLSGHELISTQTRMQSLLHRATDAIIQFESDGTISSFNSAAERIFDYPEIELLHRCGDQLFHLPPQFENNVPAYLLNYMRGTVNQYDMPLIGLKRNGSPVLLEVSVAEIETDDLVLFDDFSDAKKDVGGGYEAFLCILRDITERKRIDEELRQHRENLEVLVEEQVEEIRRAQAAAERANHAKSEFLASMSHELRTPMHAILSYSEFGLKKSGAARPEKIAQYFSRINTAGRRLLEMINDLLDLSKAEAGRLNYDFVMADLHAVVEVVMDEFESLSEQRRIGVECNELLKDPVLEMDAERIGQVVRNLLSNALKFSPEGSRVAITCVEADIEGDGGSLPGVLLRVMDEGPGIPETELESVFDKFVQSSRNDKQNGGTGLGLAISLEIVTAHHGRITACNNPGRGACFEVLLPRRHLSSEAA